MLSLGMMQNYWYSLKNLVQMNLVYLGRLVTLEKPSLIIISHFNTVTQNVNMKTHFFTFIIWRVTLILAPGTSDSHSIHVASLFSVFFHWLLYCRWWSWATVRKLKPWRCSCFCLWLKTISIAPMRWSVTTVIPWFTRSSSSPSALWDTTFWRWVLAYQM